MMIKRELINKIGVLDKDMFMYSEELDFCWRTNLSGGKIIFCPKSRVYHIGSYSIKKEKMSKQKEFLIHRNHLYTFFKNYSSLSIIRRIFPLLFLEIGAALIEPRRALSIAKAFFWILSHAKLISKKRKEIKALRKLQDEEIFGIYSKSIIMQHYILRKNKFSELKWQPKSL
jgi:GT2 family glycosyltransferase